MNKGERAMTQPIYLFDWGDTLMVDFPGQSGKMSTWEKVETVEGAEQTLQALAKEHAVYVATSAQHSSERDIEQAFQRVGLDNYLNGYYCKANLGLEKTSVAFYHAIAQSLEVEPSHLIMVGDSLEKDIYPAQQAGLNAVLYNPNNDAVPEGITHIQSLTQLLERD